MIRTYFPPKTDLLKSHKKTSKFTDSLPEAAEPKETFAEQVSFWSDMPSSSSEDEFETSDEEQSGSSAQSSTNHTDVFQRTWLHFLTNACTLRCFVSEAGQSGSYIKNISLNFARNPYPS